MPPRYEKEKHMMAPLYGATKHNKGFIRIHQLAVSRQADHHEDGNAA